MPFSPHVPAARWFWHWVYLLAPGHGFLGCRAVGVAALPNRHSLLEAALIFLQIAPLCLVDRSDYLLRQICVIANRRFDPEGPEELLGYPDLPEMTGQRKELGFFVYFDPNCLRFCIVAADKW